MRDDVIPSTVTANAISTVLTKSQLWLTGRSANAIKPSAIPSEKLSQLPRVESDGSIRM